MNLTYAAMLARADQDREADALESIGMGDLRERVPTRTEEDGDMRYTEFANAGEGRDILIVVDTKFDNAGILEGKA